MSSALHPDSINARLAEHLENSRNEILKEWTQRSSEDAAIPTEQLSARAMIDHLPRIFDDLVRKFRDSQNTAINARTKEDVVTHTALRWSQGFDLPQVLREIAHLRTSLIWQLRLFEELNPDFGIASRAFASFTLHRFLDDVAHDAVVAEIKLEKTAAAISQSK